ncbi:alpha/beta fold hydrolase [Marinobacterium sediminicola]|uniref:Polyhydroxyalkanoate synthase n=1 Tax=Marinobacterium sediminicola TaxID=518898 RepID=A0ABY1RVN6_9GAMM|nr:alpha/beta fold hydrolase [Marinobacterium sediminicola]ULG70623.1 alpha/beta fold hydrolase [Marinobacterium sediminicola]SMR68838.1 polyhydroxyalkanoate synthase [Marinobacterium sediminicola]
MTRIKVDPQQLSKQSHELEILDQCISAAARISYTHQPTAHQVLLRSGSLKLLKFEPTTSRKLTSPLLICYALVNRPWILDLSPQRSLIQNLLNEGIPVYLIDWGYPSRCDRFLNLEDYLTDLLDQCVDCASQDNNGRPVNLMGVCQGGVLSLCYSLIFPHKVRNLISLVTPADTSPANFTLNHLAQEIDATLATNTYGNLPGKLLNELFTALQPMRLGLEKRLAAGRQLCADDETVKHYLLMEHWLQDCPDLAGEALKDFIELFFRQNALMSEQGFELAGRHLKLADLRQPLLNIYGKRDQLVPPEASAALKNAVNGKDYTEVGIDAGHIGVLNGSRALHTLPPLIYNWLKKREPQ